MAGQPKLFFNVGNVQKAGGEDGNNTGQEERARSRSPRQRGGREQEWRDTEGEEIEDNLEEEEENINFERIEKCNKDERHMKLESLLRQQSWAVLSLDLKRQMNHSYGMDRDQLLETLSLFMEVRGCLMEDDRREEEEEVINMMQTLLRQLGMQRIGWTGLLAWEVEVLELVVTDNSICPDIPLFLKKSYTVILGEVKRGIEGVKMDENCNKDAVNSLLKKPAKKSFMV